MVQHVRMMSVKYKFEYLSCVEYIRMVHSKLLVIICILYEMPTLSSYLTQFWQLTRPPRHGQMLVIQKGTSKEHV